MCFFFFRISANTIPLLAVAVALIALAPTITSAQRNNHRLLYGRTSWLPQQSLNSDNDNSLQAVDDTSRAMQGDCETSLKFYFSAWEISSAKSRFRTVYLIIGNTVMKQHQSVKKCVKSCWWNRAESCTACGLESKLLWCTDQDVAVILAISGRCSRVARFLIAATYTLRWRWRRHLGIQQSAAFSSHQNEALCMFFSSM